MSEILFDGRRLVESRHCRELGKLLTQNLNRWNEFRGALGIPANEVKQLHEQLKQKPDNAGKEGETAFCSLIHIWISKNPKNATFGALIDILARQLEFFEAANAIMEREWTFV